MKRALTSTLAAVATATALFVVACQSDLPLPTTCHDIPAGGCPRRDDACKDPSCTAVYFCKSDGTWALDRTCPLNDGAVPDVAAPVNEAGVRDASADVEGANGGPGCEDLMQPDCALGTAVACGQGCCGCEDLYVCQNGGWLLWGSCNGGTITPEAPRDR